MKSDVSVDCKGMNCPMPLVETRKALKKMKEGEILEVEGDHMVSKKEIPMAMDMLGNEVIEIKEERNSWKIWIKKVA